MTTRTRWRKHGAALAALVGIWTAGCTANAGPSGGTAPAGPPEDPAPNGSGDPMLGTSIAMAVPTAEDFVAVTTTPANTWVSGPSDFDLATAPDAITSTSAQVRQTIWCMRRFATQAYDASSTSLHEDCTLKPVPWNSTEVMKLWDPKATVEGGPYTIVIAFAGSRMTRIEDVVQDLQDQDTVAHQNPLDPSLPGLPGVASGWDARWRHAAEKLKGPLDWYLDAARSQGNTLNVYVVGHSVGGATATLAGYDIERYVAARSEGLKWRVYVYAFNPPRLGNTEARDQYQDALLATSQPQGTTCPARSGQTCLVLRQLTRSSDSVEGAPTSMSHPLWSTPQPSPRCDRTLGPGPHQDLLLGYCAHLEAPKLASWNRLENHSLLAWDQQLKDATDAVLINGLFAVH